MRNFLSIIFSLLLFQSAFGQNLEKVENLKTFAKLYGYVKYFHPADEAANIDWNKFAIFGESN